jgi:gliding motility-associated-like protein
MKKFYLVLSLLLSSICFCQEICDNGVDDDGDGLIDLNDSECICNSVQSIIPNPSFEEFDMCPNWYSQMNYCADWVQGTNTTTDFMHKCNYILPSVVNANLDNFPDGNGIGASIFSESKSEYLGSCLSSPMEAGTNYQMTLQLASLPISGTDLSDCYFGSDIYYDPIDITLYGSTNCNSLPLNTFNSPSLANSEWIILGSVNYIPVSHWAPVTISFIPPTDINTIMIGAPETLPASYSLGTCVPYFLFDDILLNKSNLFGVNITEEGNYCDNTLLLIASPILNISNSTTYQWYRNGIAIIGATESTYSVTLGGINPDNYSVRIIDGSNCFISQPFVPTTQLPMPDFTVVQPTCYENGTITITTEADLYSFDNGETWGTVNIASNLLPGLYFIKIKSGSNCISGTSSVTLNTPYYISQPNTSGTDATCGPTGSITVLTQGTEYSIDNGLTWSTNPVFNNLYGGIYYVRIKNNNGCMSLPNATYIYQILLEAPSYTFISPDCSDQNGSITITTPAEEYSFDLGLTWTTNPTLTGLSTGPHWIMIKDSNGCISLDTGLDLYRESIDKPEYEILQACGANGSITITTNAYEYSINNGVSWFSTAQFNNLSPGIYALKVRNENGCTSFPAYVYLDEVIWNILPTYNYITPDCHQSGSITIQTSAYEYSFNGGYTWTTNNVLENLAYDHSYQIVVRKSNGCQSNIQYVNIGPNTVSQAPAVVITQPNCSMPEGSILVTSTAYQYSFDNGITWSSSNNSGPLSGGTYMVKIKTVQECESPVTEVVINDAPTIPNTPEVSVTNPTCTVATGSITITTAAAFYSFNNGATWVTTNTLDNLIPGTYHIKIKNNQHGCASPAAEAIISSEGGPSALPDVLDVSYCQGEIPTILTASGVNLLWYESPAGGTGAETAPTPSTTTTGTITYYVTQTIGNCESQRAAITVTVWPTPAPPAVNNYEYCQGDITTALIATGDNLLWYTQPTGGTGSTAVPIPSSQSAGTFAFYVSQSLNACESKRAMIIVQIKPTPDTPETETTVTFEHLTETSALTAAGIGLKWYDNNLNLLWTAPVPSSANIGSTTYYVSQVIDGCESPLKEVTVIITRTYITIDYPKFFTPNGDGQNETWNIVTPKHGIKCSILIFDRYGKVIEGITAPGRGWDGTFNGHNLPATDYWFLVKYTEYDKEKEFKSHFSLIR